MADDKIKANEMLDDAELDKVAGGFSEETVEDMMALKNYLGINCSQGVDNTTAIHYLKENYANAGILFKHHDDGPNEYYTMSGTRLSHAQAMEAFAKIGRELQR